jgi:putative phosphoesterase
VAKIGIISDTHDNLPAVDAALERLEKMGVRLLLHAGDIVAPFTLRRILSRGFEFRGVFGNNDGELLLLSRVARDQGAVLTHQPLVTDVEGLRAVVLHGLSGLEETKSFVTALAKSGEYDLVVYGHTHEVDVRKVGRTLIVNPGEACGYLTGKKSFAVLDAERMEVEIVTL